MGPKLDPEKGPGFLASENNGRDTSSDTNEPTVLCKFSKNDPDNPHNLSLFQKVYFTITITGLALTAGMSSAIFSPGNERIMDDYNVSREVALLSTALVLIGYTFGCVIWAAVNEAFGRRAAWTGSTLLFILFQIPSGVNPNIQTLMIGRFFQGLTGISALISFGGSTSDVWSWKVLSFPSAVALTSVFAAPAFGPTLGALLLQYVSFGWLSWIIMIIGGFFVIMSFFMSETYATIVLRSKAIRLRKQGHNVYAAIEVNPVTLKSLVTKYVTRPVVMTIDDKVLLFLCGYIALAYGLLYGSLEAIPYAFQEYRNYSFVTRYLPSISILIGVLLTDTVMVLANKPLKEKRALKGEMKPEDRLPLMLVAAVVLPIGLFLLAWTAPYPSVHWIVPSIAGALIGSSSSAIYIGVVLYTLEAYGELATSALAANAIFRSAYAALVLLTITRMFEKMTFQGAMSFYGGISILIAPGPYILLKYGDRWRATSKWTVKAP